MRWMFAKPALARFEGLKGFGVQRMLEPAACVVAVAILQANLGLLVDGEFEAAGQKDVLRRKQGNDGAFLFVLRGLGNGDCQQVDGFLALFGLRDLDDFALSFGLGLIFAGLGGDAAIKPIVEPLRLDARLGGRSCGKMNTQAKRDGCGCEDTHRDTTFL